MKRFVGWGIGAAIGMALLAPIAACEQDPLATAVYERGDIDLPEAGPPYVPPPTPDAAPNAPAVDAAPEASTEIDAGTDAAPLPTCNDGTVDPGETCDPLSSCPALCPPVQCQLRSLENGGTCTATCKDAALQTQCVNGDGCCPPTCNANNDDDCKTICGNSVIEAGETCDPLASCPTSCLALGCQLRTLQGAGTCAAKCVDGAKQTACVNGDGCCPAGCNANDDSDCGPGCGNNVIEAGETCDPLASCPTTCPPIKCQLRTLQNAGTCQAQCVDSGMQTACANNDGCCPATCNANNDNDCAPECGNSVVEKGETCDPLTSCPASCPMLGCQIRKLDNAGTCQAVCSAAGIQDQCVNGDGCCPKGCNANNDNDCKPVCGNGVVEKGETCDSPGKCPTQCAKSKYTCVGSSGEGTTCDLVCDKPAACGTSNDNCCPYDATGGCGSGTDKDCAGGDWKYITWPTAIDTTKQCVDVVIRGIVAGGSYDLTTCAPKGEATGDGDPVIKNVVDDKKNAYSVDNDNCTDKTALPNLAGSNCTNKKGQLVMACASPSPGGFIALPGATAFTVTFCAGPGGGGTTPLYIWFNAPSEPSTK